MCAEAVGDVHIAEAVLGQERLEARRPGGLEEADEALKVGALVVSPISNMSPGSSLRDLPVSAIAADAVGVEAVGARAPTKRDEGV